MEKNWFNKKLEEVKKDLSTNLENGLSIEEVKKRQEEYGFNELKEENLLSNLKIFL